MNYEIISLEEYNEAIDDLTREIERLNNIINKKEQFLGDNIKRLEREVVKRDNIINEFEKWLEEKSQEYRFYYEHNKADTLDIALYKLQELKGSDKENK